MKKLLFLFLSLTILSACSSDDEGDVQETDPIVGTWVLVSSSTINPDNCEQASTLTLNQNNSASGTFYVDQLDCTPQSSTGTWENLGGSRYELTVPVIGNLSGTVTFSGNNEFTFTTDSFGSFSFERQ